MVHSPPETALLESSAPRTSGPFLSYEFIDSQDPNTKSQIQRHTAHHAVQQRREAARKRLLREGSTPRLLAWQRRLSSETTSSSISFSNSTNSLPTFPPTEPSIVTPTDETVMNHNPTSSPSEQQAPAIMPYTDSEEALLQYCMFIPRCCLGRCPSTDYIVRCLNAMQEKKPRSLLLTTID